MKNSLAVLAVLAAAGLLAACATNPNPPAPPGQVDPLNCKDPRNRENPYCQPGPGGPDTMSNKIKPKK